MDMILHGIVRVGIIRLTTTTQYNNTVCKNLNYLYQLLDESRILGDYRG